MISQPKRLKELEAKAKQMKLLGVNKITLCVDDFELFKRLVSRFVRDQIKDSFEWEGVLIKRG